MINHVSAQSMSDYVNSSLMASTGVSYTNTSCRHSSNICLNTRVVMLEPLEASPLKNNSRFNELIFMTDLNISTDLKINIPNLMTRYLNIEISPMLV